MPPSQTSHGQGTDPRPTMAASRWCPFTPAKRSAPVCSAKSSATATLPTNNLKICYDACSPMIRVARERYSAVLIPRRINSAHGRRMERASMTPSSAISAKRRMAGFNPPPMPRCTLKPGSFT